MAQIYIDAATRQNPFESAIGYVIKHNDINYEFGMYIGEMENHEAEWNSLIAALQTALEMNVTTALIKSDSKMVTDAIHKDFVKNPKFKSYLTAYQDLAQRFDLIMVNWIPREQNKHADTIARRYLNKK